MFTKSKRKTLDDFIVVEPKKSTLREMAKVEAHVTTVTPEKIYSLPGTSSDQFPLTYGYNNDLGCYLTTSLSDQDKYKLLKDCLVPDSSFSYLFSVHSKKQKSVNCY
ncbi:unnamed protein product, partial [Callosobruchus maculatus]